MVTVSLSGVPCWVSPDLDLWKGTWVDKPGQNSDKTSPYATTPCKVQRSRFSFFSYSFQIKVFNVKAEGPLGWADLLPLLVGAVPTLEDPSGIVLIQQWSCHDFLPLLLVNVGDI